MRADRLVGRHSRSTYERILIFTVLGVLIVTTSGCGTPSPSAVPRTVAPSPSPTTVPVKANKVPSALHDWVRGASARSYQQSTFWRRAASSLSAVATKNPAQRNAYRSAELELRQLASLPETSDTAAQRSTAKHDVRELNIFFGTKNLYE